MGIRRVLLFIILLTSCMAAHDKRDGNLSRTPSASSICDSDSPMDCVNDEMFGGYGADTEKQTVDISFVFVNSSSEQLSFNANNDAIRIINSLNQQFKSGNYQHLKFSLKTVEEVSDDLYTNTECDNLESVLELYGKLDSLTFVLVNDLASTCRGVAKLWVNPAYRFSGLLLEYNQNIESYAHVYAHEIGHNLGLHHSARTYAESAPVSGLYNFNQLLGMGGVLFNRCATDFPYFIDPQAQSQNSSDSGYSFNSYQNTMYPSYGDGVTRSFFSEGYQGSSSRAFDCWYDVVKQSGIGLSFE